MGHCPEREMANKMQIDYREIEERKKDVLKTSDEVVVIGTAYHGIIGDIVEVGKSEYGVNVRGIDRIYRFPFDLVMRRSDHPFYRAKES